MTVREREIGAFDFKTNQQITVRYTPEIQTYDDLSGATRQFEMPYVFTAIANFKQETLTYYADARKHTDFEQALKADPETKVVEKWWYGQLTYSLDRDKFSSFYIRELPGNNPQQVLRNLKTFFDRINPEFIADVVVICTDGIDSGHIYTYYPLAKRFRRFDNSSLGK